MNKFTIYCVKNVSAMKRALIAVYAASTDFGTSKTNRTGVPKKIIYNRLHLNHISSTFGCSLAESINKMRCMIGMFTHNLKSDMSH